MEKQTFVSFNAKQISLSLGDYRKETILEAMATLKASSEEQEEADNSTASNEGESIVATEHCSTDIDDQDADSGILTTWRMNGGWVFWMELHIRLPCQKCSCSRRGRKQLRETSTTVEQAGTHQLAMTEIVEEVSAGGQGSRKRKHS